MHIRTIIPNPKSQQQQPSNLWLSYDSIVELSGSLLEGSIDSGTTAGVGGGQRGPPIFGKISLHRLKLGREAPEDNPKLFFL